MAKAVNKKVKWTETLITLLLASFGVYFVVAAFSLQLKIPDAILSIIFYILGFALLGAAKVFKHKAFAAE